MTAYNTITINDDGDICIVTTTTNEAKQLNLRMKIKLQLQHMLLKMDSIKSILLNQINLILRVSTVLKRPLPRKHLNLRIKV